MSLSSSNNVNALDSFLRGYAKYGIFTASLYSGDYFVRPVRPMRPVVGFLEDRGVPACDDQHMCESQKIKKARYTVRMANNEFLYNSSINPNLAISHVLEIASQQIDRFVLEEICTVDVEIFENKDIVGQVKGILHDLDHNRVNLNKITAVCHPKIRKHFFEGESMFGSSSLSRIEPIRIYGTKFVFTNTIEENFIYLVEDTNIFIKEISEYEDICTDSVNFLFNFGFIGKCKKVKIVDVYYSNIVDRIQEKFQYLKNENLMFSKVAKDVFDEDVDFNLNMEPFIAIDGDQLDAVKMNSSFDDIKIGSDIDYLKLFVTNN